MDTNEQIQKLKMLRAPFSENHISKLPKPTKAQTDEVKRDFKTGVRCNECGGWHHPKVVHLDYVGHAALTDRLLTVDPLWNWDHAHKNENGTPVIDQNGGFWINLTVCGVTRLGYGDAQGKQGGDAMKECIGDALRNAAMRFGCALDLWHKGDLHKDELQQEAAEDKAITLSDNDKLWVDAFINNPKVLDHPDVTPEYKQFIIQQARL